MELGTVFAMPVEILRNSKKMRVFLTVRVLKSANLFSQEIFNVSWRMGFIEDKSDLYFAAESGTQECKCYVSLRTIGHLKNGYTVGPRRQERALKYLALFIISSQFHKQIFYKVEQK